MDRQDRFPMTLPSLFGAGLLVVLAPAPAQAALFGVTNLVSDGFVPAATIYPSLVNPWGVAASPTGPFWVSDNGTGVSTLYNTAGAKIPLTVTIPTAAGGTGPASPTGQVFNGTTGFQVSSGGKTAKAVFLFATEDGTISGWAPSVAPTTALLAVDNSTMGAGAVYKGLTVGTVGGSSFLYAADFRNGLVEKFDSSFKLVGSFTDPGVAAGFAPFNTQVLNGNLYVTYALQNSSKHDNVDGSGNGYVDEFSLDGTLIKRLVTGTSALNSPWGLAIAPASFGALAGDLLVGNFGDGTISAFDPTSGAFAGKLLGADSNPLVLGDLWALTVGNGGAGGDPNKVYFTAGLQDEAHGLFGSIQAVPEPSTWAMLLAGFGSLGGALRMRRRRSTNVALA